MKRYENTIEWSASNSGFSQQCRDGIRIKGFCKHGWCQQFRVLSAMPGTATVGL